MLLHGVRTNYTQHLGCVDQPLQEDFEILFREQGGYREHGEYTYNGWCKFDIVLKFIIEPCTNVIV